MGINGLLYAMTTCSQSIKVKRIMATQLWSKYRKDQKTGGSPVTGVCFQYETLLVCKLQIAISVVPGKLKYNIKSVVLIV